MERRLPGPACPDLGRAPPARRCSRLTQKSMARLPGHVVHTAGGMGASAVPALGRRLDTGAQHGAPGRLVHGRMHAEACLADFGGDGEAGGHVEAQVCHLTQVGALATQLRGRRAGHVAQGSAPAGRAGGGREAGRRALGTSPGDAPWAPMTSGWRRAARGAASGAGGADAGAMLADPRGMRMLAAAWQGAGRPTHQGLHLLAPRAAALLEDIDLLLLRGEWRGWGVSQRGCRRGCPRRRRRRPLPPPDHPLAARDQPPRRRPRADPASQCPWEGARRVSGGPPPRPGPPPNPTQNHLCGGLHGLLAALERLLHRANDASQRAGHFC